VNTTRVLALLGKELLDLRGRPGIFVPGILTGAIAIFMPIFVAVIVPAVTGELLSDSADFQVALDLYRDQPWTRLLDPEAAIQSTLFQQFLILLVLSPVSAAMSLAAHSVIGEKQARSLEPLLATPITTTELLLAKVAGAMLPSLAIMMCTTVIYMAGVAWLAEPGVLRTLLSPKTALLVFGLGPITSGLALQVGVLVSARVNDPRTAQQFGALFILPLTALFMAQMSGVFVLTVGMGLLVFAGLFAAWVLLLFLGVKLFRREAILTRWK